MVTITLFPASPCHACLYFKVISEMRVFWLKTIVDSMIARKEDCFALVFGMEPSLFSGLRIGSSMRSI